MPKKTYDMKRMPFVNDPIAIPAGATAAAALDRVLRLPSVCSKRCDSRASLKPIHLHHLHHLHCTTCTTCTTSPLHHFNHVTT